MVPELTEDDDVVVVPLVVVVLVAFDPVITDDVVPVPV